MRFVTRTNGKVAIFKQTLIHLKLFLQKIASDYKWTQILILYPYFITYINAKSPKINIIVYVNYTLIKNTLSGR